MVKLRYHTRLLLSCFMGAIPGCFAWCWIVNDMSKFPDSADIVFWNAILMAPP